MGLLMKTERTYKGKEYIVEIYKENDLYVLVLTKPNDSSYKRELRADSFILLQIYKKTGLNPIRFLLEEAMNEMEVEEKSENFNKWIEELKLNT